MINLNRDVDELFDELAVMDGENDEPEGVKEPEEEVSAAKGKKVSGPCYYVHLNSHINYKSFFRFFYGHRSLFLRRTI